LGDIYVYDKEFVIVDLPGLIENARWACAVIIQNVLYNIFNQTNNIFINGAGFPLKRL
jgi:hypothetical protein